MSASSELIFIVKGDKIVESEISKSSFSTIKTKRVNRNDYMEDNIKEIFKRIKYDTIMVFVIGDDLCFCY